MNVKSLMHYMYVA